MKKLQVFISHVSGEAELASLLKIHIETDFIGLFEVFVSSDGTSIVVGDKWLDTVKCKLRSADFYIVLCSQDSVDRQWINIEIGAALARDKRIIPVCHTDLTREQLQRRPLSDYERFNVSDPAGLKGLYSVLQTALESAMPSVDFDKFARETAAFETRYRTQKETIVVAQSSPPPNAAPVVLSRPRVLCVSSQQFRDAVRADWNMIVAAFPEEARHELITESESLKPLLATNHFDIIHVATYICPASGDLVFNSIDPLTKENRGPRDRLAAETFVRLVRESGAVVVVLANNETLALVTKLLPVTNVVFALEPVGVEALIRWIESFYSLLAKDFSLADACRKAFAQHQIPMRMYRQLPEAFSEPEAPSQTSAVTV